MRPTKVVLDTSAYSQLRVGHPAVVDAVARASIVYVPTTVLGELEAGFLLGRRYQENTQALTEFLSEPFVAILSVTADVAKRYGKVFMQLRKAGTPVPVNDIWIAATALDAGAHLLTLDRDFDHIVDLEHTVFAV